jgi:Ca2+/H+ antiporter
MDLAISVTLGFTIQTAMFVFPLIVVIGWILRMSGKNRVLEAPY